MKKIIIASILLILPIGALAQTDFNLDNLLNNTVPTADIVINKFDLVWSTDTYTPFDYAGRNLPVIGSQVRVDAIINAIGGSARSLKYSWFLEDIFQQNKSGYGKDSFSFYVQQRPGNFHTIRVQVFNEDRTVFEEKTIQIPITEPEVVIYSSNNNSHFSNQASGEMINVFGDKLSLIAKPYFFSIKKLTDLVFEWTLSGQEPVRSSDYNASILNLIIKNAQGTQNNLWLNVNNPDESRQSVSQNINLDIQ